MTRNIKITIEYDGTQYKGWQIQPGLPTIQQALENGVFRLVQTKTPVTGAGRTDSGVHALGQVANFKTDSQLTLDIFQKGLNRFLPLDIRIMKVEEVPLEFHSRFDATFRKYRFTLATVKHALNRDYVTYCKHKLNFEAMKSAAQSLSGRHDFQSFCRLNPELPHYFCEILSLALTRTPDAITMEITANRFLHNMVRIIMGTLVEVGREKIPVEAVAQILAARNRKAAGKTISGRGLILVEVGY